MNGTATINAALKSTQDMLNWYIGDLSDADLVNRPVPGANHIAWQLGHLIGSEVHLLKGEIPDAEYPELPAGFMERYSKESSKSDDAGEFSDKVTYLDLFNKVRAATMATVEKLTDADLDKPTQGSMAKIAPRLGELLVLVSNHTLMHAGQFTVLRRKLDKPILF